MGAVTASLPRLRPLTVADVLDESFRIYRANFPLLAGLALALALPALAITLISGSYSVVGAAIDAVSHPTSAPPDFTPPNSLATILQYPLQLALLPFQVGALLLASSSILLGNPATILSVLRDIARRYFALMALAVLYIAVLFALFCPPLGIWLAVRLAFAVNVLVVEKSGIGAAIERSWQLTNRAFWRTFAVLGLGLVLNQVLETAVAPVFMGAAAFAPGLPSGVRGALVISTLALVAQLLQPLLALAVTLIYLDMRVRREALDLELIALRIGQSGSERSS